MPSMSIRPSSFDWPFGNKLLNFLFLSTFFIILQCSNSNANENLTTVLVCEGGLASLHCPPQHEIVVHLANFGRFALHTCNPTMRLDINVKCHNPHTIDVLRARCEHRQRCVVPVNWAIFPPAPHPHSSVADGFVGGIDQCPGTPKYLDAVYGCIQATTTTSTTTLSTISATSSTIALPSAGKLPFDGGGKIGDDEVNDDENGVAKSPLGCSFRIARHLHWPRTPLGQIVRLACPKGSRGLAEWKCSPESNWTPELGPNLSRCISDWARELKEDLDELGIESSGEEKRNWLEILREGHAQVRKEELMGGDARVLAEVIGEIAEKMTKKREAELGILLLNDLQNNEEMKQKKQQEALQFVRLIIDTFGHLLRMNQRATWFDLSQSQRRKLAMDLLEIMPKTLSLLLPLPNWPKAGSESLLAEPTLVAEIAQANIYNYVPFPSMSLYRQNFDTALLPREALQFFGQDLANVFYTAWDSSLGNHLLMEGKGRKMITKMIGISIVPLNGKIVHSMQIRQIEQPILLTFQNAEYYLDGGSRIVDEPKCVWWNWEAWKFIEEGEDGEEDGCKLREYNQTHILCECNKMNTQYAVMANVEANDEGMKAGKWVIGGNEQSILLCILLAISASIALICICLSLLIIFFILRNSTPKGEQIKLAQRRHQNARVHFCVLLILLEAIFLAQIIAKNNVPPCKPFSLIRNYSILAILCWTLLDAFELCQLARRLFPQNDPPKVNCSSILKIVAIILFGYGFPFLLIFMAISISNWPQNDDCWSIEHFQPNISFTFIGPISFILVATICFLFATFWALRSGNAKCAQKSGTTFFSAIGYHPCSTNSTMASNNQSTQQQQREERKLLKGLRQRLKWICARVTLLAVAISSTICWATIIAKLDGNDDQILSFLLAFMAILANAGIGISIFWELIFDKKTQSCYCCWRIEKQNSPILFLLKPVDLLLCFSPKNGHLSKKNKTTNGSIEFPKIKFAHHSPINVGSFTPNSSSNLSATNAGCTNSVGIGNGAMSACSEFSTTAEIQLSSSSNNSGSENGGGGLFSNNPPPPAPLLQLYQEHKMLQNQQRNATADVEGIQQMDNNFSGEINGGEAYDEYATIPYEELLTAYHHQKLLHQHQQYSPRPIPTPRCFVPPLYSSSSVHCPYSPRLMPSQSNLNNYMGSPSIYGGGPFPIRFGLIGDQQQVSHQQLPIGINDPTLMQNYDQFHHQIMAEQPKILEMGIHSAPPNFPPPPPPAPPSNRTTDSIVGYPIPMGDHPVHFRRSSSGSLRSGGSTLVLRMDLSRQQPLISERIDDIEDMFDDDERTLPED